MDSREKLIAAARDLLWRDGYSATSPNRIQKHARVGPGSMYHHFDGKSDLAREAIVREAEDMRRRAAESFEGTGSPITRVEAYLWQEREILRGCPVGGLLQDSGVVHDRTLLSPIQETFSWILSQVEGLLSEAAEQGELGPDLAPHDVAATVVAVIQGAYVLAISQQSDAPYRSAIDGAIALLRPR
ncbi:TetR/AcrR family transcriptional regulator [Pimelobacter simplex]|uniref:TetR/AcrR family transcriptional regulator n=1 Tax=Nocardioides simplex TaxID=2045 RepID=A0A7J5E4P4_NOCSI|nr:TetR/AcrR family transcriptional regulator [Pimelobacter simplex]KAB2813232.1 TetR/AcrR family transcriptional regulator [Pimelobacter simplex]